MTLLPTDFNLLELDLELEITKRILACREESLQIIKARQQGGLANMLEVRQAEELVYQASQTIPDTQRLTEQSENQINLLLETILDPLRVVLHCPGRRNCRLSCRIAASSLLRATTGYQVGGTASDLRECPRLCCKKHFPTISLTGAFGFQSNSLANLFSGPSRALEFHPQVTQPIFTAGLNLNRMSILKRPNASTRWRSNQQTVQTAFSDVSNALVQYRRVREIRTQQELLVSSLQEASSLAHLRIRGWRRHTAQCLCS